ncbi:MAG: 2-C-methyl-D-erythritol 2,4-cyclodiphosphate synthase [Candidatus Firestonebacteria bacterium]
MSKLRIGLGYDIHPFQSGKQLTLGGVKIPFNKGLEGHSDGDCLVHSLIDALLGASGKGDIGRIFGVDRPENKDIMSIILLGKTHALIKSKYRIVNIDAVLLCEEPRLSGYLPIMKKNIARVLKIKETAVNIKSTTAKKLGEIGKVKAIASQSIVLLSLR